jgi:hypothetical protein
MGFEARKGSEAGPDIGEGRRWWWRRWWRWGFWRRKPVVQRKAGQVSGDLAVVLEVCLCTDYVDDKLRGTVLLEFWTGSGGARTPKGQTHLEAIPGRPQMWMHS